ncbi:hypothetical protein XarCFBP6762_19870 [Xanthomonas arboricola]|nr:hypothetical protein XarCFBP6762_19870 [Xanthomonas arboricola]
MCVVGRQRGAASSVGTRRESVPGGSVATSMSPHGPAPGRGTTLPRLLLLIGKQCFRVRADACAVCGQCKSASHLSAATSSAMATRRSTYGPTGSPHFFQQPTTTGGACAGAGVGP